MSVPWAQIGQGPFTVDSGGGPGQPSSSNGPPNQFPKHNAMNSGPQMGSAPWPYYPQQNFQYSNNMLDPRLAALSSGFQNGQLPSVPQQMWPLYSGLPMHPLLQQSMSNTGANFPPLGAPPLLPFLQPNMLPFLQQQSIPQASTSSMPIMQPYLSSSASTPDPSKQSTSSQKGRRTKTASANNVSFAPLPDSSFDPIPSTSSSRNAQYHASPNPTDFFSASQNCSPKQSKSSSRRSSVQQSPDPSLSWSQPSNHASTPAPFDTSLYRSPAQSAPVSRRNSQDYRTDFYSQTSAPLSRQGSQEQRADLYSQPQAAEPLPTADADFVAQMWELYGGPAPVPEGVTMENLTWRLREVQLSQAMTGNGPSEFQQYQQDSVASTSEQGVLQPSRAQEAKEVEEELETRGRKTTVRTAGNTPEDSTGSASTPHSQKDDPDEMDWRAKSISRSRSRVGQIADMDWRAASRSRSRARSQLRNASNLSWPAFGVNESSFAEQPEFDFNAFGNPLSEADRHQSLEDILQAGLSNIASNGLPSTTEDSSLKPPASQSRSRSRGRTVDDSDVFDFYNYDYDYSPSRYLNANGDGYNFFRVNGSVPGLKNEQEPRENYHSEFGFLPKIVRKTSFDEAFQTSYSRIADGKEGMSREQFLKTIPPALLAQAKQAVLEGNTSAVDPLDLLLPHPQGSTQVEPTLPSSSSYIPTPTGSQPVTPNPDTYVDPLLLLNGSTYQYPTLNSLLPLDTSIAPFSFSPDGSIPHSPADPPLSATYSSASPSFDPPLSASSTVSLSDLNFSGGPTRTTSSKAARQQTSNFPSSRGFIQSEDPPKASVLQDSASPPDIPPPSVPEHTGLSVCFNCSTSNTPLWRRDEEGRPLCNGCGLFKKLHGVNRPLSLATGIVKKRNRAKGKEKKGTTAAAGRASRKATAEKKKKQDKVEEEEEDD